MPSSTSRRSGKRSDNCCASVAIFERDRLRDADVRAGHDVAVARLEPRRATRRPARRRSRPARAASRRRSRPAACRPTATTTAGGVVPHRSERGSPARPRSARDRRAPCSAAIRCPGLRPWCRSRACAAPPPACGLRPRRTLRAVAVLIPVLVAEQAQQRARCCRARRSARTVDRSASHPYGPACRRRRACPDARHARAHQQLDRRAARSFDARRIVRGRAAASRDSSGRSSAPKPPATTRAMRTPSARTSRGMQQRLRATAHGLAAGDQQRARHARNRRPR